MNSFSMNYARKVVPRWRSARVTMLMGEMGTGASRTPDIAAAQSEFKRKLADWESERSGPFAAEVLGCAVALGLEIEAKSVAEVVLGGEVPATSSTVALSRKILGLPPAIASEIGAAQEGDTLDTGKTISLARARLKRIPNNPLLWADLSRSYVTIGKADPAKRAMAVALSLAPNNRFILRAASRLHLHLDDFGRAHDIVRKVASGSRDPWLLATEIVTAEIAGRTSENIKRARRCAEQGQFPSFHLSELNSALGTLELGHGSIRKARRFFEASLIAPTDNTLAQAAWAERQDRGLHVPQEAIEHTLRSFEASALSLFNAGEWRKSLAQSLRWFEDLPFSTRPIVHGSYVAGVVLEDFPASVRIARFGLRANPDDVYILNNLAFSLAQEGKAADARAAFEKIRLERLSEEEKIVACATAGLIAFRAGDAETGRHLYEISTKMAEVRENRRYLLMGLAYHALEEARVQSGESQRLGERVVGKFNAEEFPDLVPLINRVQKTIIKT